MTPAISVVVATLGRPQKLERSLAAYARLDPATPPFEVVVSLDGEDPASRTVAERPWPFERRVVCQPRNGTGPAKNLGAAAARAPYLLFLNDDAQPAPDCLLAHARALAEMGEAIYVGHVDWDPEREVTPYMAWLAPSGHQFNFSRLRPAEAIPWDACWGAHLGVPRRWFEEQPFDPLLTIPSLEDTLWGFRQQRRGRPLRYLAAARAFHDHRYEGPADYRGRAMLSGAAARYAARRHRQLRWPLALRPALAAVAALLRAAWPGRWRGTTLWDLDYRWHYLRGLALGPDD